MALILVIEDHAVNLELVRYLLESHGHEVLTAADGAAGLALARRMQPDLVICDLQLPGLDGHAVAAALRADPQLAQRPLLAVTAAAMVGDRDRALAAGFDAHLPKPIDPVAFVPWVERHLPAPGPGPSAAPPSPSAGPAPPIDPALRCPRPGLVLLMVDDTPVHQEYKRELLEPAGYTVQACDGGQAAWQRLNEGGVDAVVSDVVMPGVDGWELLHRVRGAPALARLPFVFLTSTVREPAARERALRAGADEFLLRPIEPLALLRALRRVLDMAARG